MARRLIVGSGTGAPRLTAILRIGFVEPLPREESWHDACEFCERDVESYEGPHAARN